MEALLMRLLRIDSSARRSSVTRKLTQRFVETWKLKHRDGQVMEPDLSTTVLPVTSDEWIEAAHSDPSQWTPAHKQALSSSDTLVAELAAADIVVIGAPMYNFSIPFPLKAWIDQIVRSNKTFTYGPGGAKGLLAGKKVVIITARAGAYGPGNPARKADFQEPYLRFIFEFIGLTDVTFIHAENQGRPGADLSLASAAARIVEVATAANPQVRTQ
jgi:FMN-dependent NADH-azoreductase